MQLDHVNALLEKNCITVEKRVNNLSIFDVYNNDFVSKHKSHKN